LVLLLRRCVLQAAAAAGQGSDAPLVVCVDDDEVSHLVLAGMLQSQGYRYQKVASGAEALRLLDAAARQPPNLVLLNAALPDTTGLDVLRGLRQRASQVALPVIVLTAHHTARAIVEALDAGANDYVIKPLRRAELLARIRMHLRSTSKAAAAAAATVAPALPTTADGVAAGVVGGSSPAALLSPEQQAMQRSLGHAETLEAVPVLVLQLEGLDAAAAAAAGSADAMCQLLGYVADCCDAMVEKYALVKVRSRMGGGGRQPGTSMHLVLLLPYSRCALVHVRQ
jgi:DNA-binding response OmpR family regulator